MRSGSIQTIRTIRKYFQFKAMGLIKNIDFAAFLVYGLGLLTLGASGWRPFKIIISNLTAEAYSPKCKVNASVSDSSILDLNVELMRIVRSPFINTKLYFQSDNGKYDMEVLNRTVNLCKLYKDKRYEPIIQVVFKLFEAYFTHWFKSCPLNIGLYYLNNVELNVEKLPPFFPEKSGVFNLVLLDKEGPLFGFVSVFRILKTYKKN